MATRRDIALMFIGFATLLLTVSMASAATKNTDEPIRVDARTVEANEKTGVVIYSGDVVAEQGQLSIRADRLEIHTKQGKTELVRAFGNPAKLRQQAEDKTQEIQAEAGRVDYHFSRRQIDLFDHVRVRRGEDLFTADVLHYDLNTQSLNAAGTDKGKGRVHAVIQPSKMESATSAPETPHER